MAIQAKTGTTPQLGYCLFETCPNNDIDIRSLPGSMELMKNVKRCEMIIGCILEQEVALGVQNA